MQLEFFFASNQKSVENILLIIMKEWKMENNRTGDYWICIMNQLTS